MPIATSATPPVVEPSVPGTPIPYDPEMERIDASEAETIAELKETLLEISQTVYEDSGHAPRSVHAKSHGLLRGELQVLGGLPEPLAQGLFAQPGRYPLVMRLSTPPGDVLDDQVSLPRGVAIKVMEVPGARLPGSHDDTVQDFLMVDGPAFLAPDAAHFLRNLKMLAATTDKAEGLKKLVSTVLRGAEQVLEKVGHPSGKVKSMGGHPMTHPLGETFFTQVPLRHGLYMAKLSLAPVSPDLTALTGAPLDLKGHPEGLREAVRAHVRSQASEWELRAQLCTDLDAMPIEDASVEWPQDLSPYVAVARVVVPAQDSWAEASADAIDDSLSFSPWHGLVAHQPIGSVMRARRETYEASVAFRGQANGCPMHQPRSVGDVFGEGLP